MNILKLGLEVLTNCLDLLAPSYSSSFQVLCMVGFVGRAIVRALAILPRCLPVVLSVSAISPVYAEVIASDGLSAEEVAISSKNSAIGGIKQGMSEQQVQRILGKPIKRQRVKTPYCGEDVVFIYYTYRNTKVQLFEDAGTTKVDMVEVSNRFYRTDKGIRVGDSIEKAKTAYPTLKRAEDSNTWYSTQTWFAITANKQGKITKISLGYEMGC